MWRILQDFLSTHKLAYFITSVIFIGINTYFFFPAFGQNEIKEFSFLQNQLTITIILSIFMGFALICSGDYIFNFFGGSIFKGGLFWLGLPLKYVQKLKRNRYVKKIEKLSLKISKSKSEEEKEYLETERDEIKCEMLMRFPEDYRDLQPTSLGNIFMAFKYYPLRVYGIDVEIFWPRLTNFIPDNFADSLEKASNSLVFFLISSSLFTIMGLESLLMLLLKQSNEIPLFLLKFLVLLCFFLSISFYRVSLYSAFNFGELFKSCFDLFRHDLIRSFKVTKKLNLKDEKFFWEKLSRLIKLGEGDIDKFTDPQIKFE